MPLSIVTIVGARPQFVKAGALSREIRASGKIFERIVHTGQHYDDLMSDIFFREMSIPAPEINLHIGGGTHGENTGRMIEGIERILIKNRPSLLLVYGDTDSTLAGAIAASKLRIPILHVEAGLRSYRRDMPEEINRVLTDHAADVLYAPSIKAANNLVAEGIDTSQIVVTGDVMFDVCKLFLPVALAKSSILRDLGLIGRPFNLATVHRKENTDNTLNLAAILEGLGASSIDVLLPIHPRTAKKIQGYGLSVPSNVRVIDPVGYFDMLALLNGCETVLTDSGGLQKEAYFVGKRCLTLRDETEWTELVEQNWNSLVGADRLRIAEQLTKQWTPGEASHIYGDGHAAERICADILERFS